LADWTNYRITYQSDDEEFLTPEILYNAIDIALTNNINYIAYIQALVGTPFESICYRCCYK
jgi:hypothetical protein